MIRIIACILCTCALALLCISVDAQKRERKNTEVTAALEFTAGNIVVCRVGTGTGSLTTAAAAVFLDEYTSDGTFVSTTAMPTANGTVQKALTVAGTAAAITECHLNRSSDGQYLVLAGYAAAPGTAGVSGSGAQRVFARVDSAGNVDTSTTTDSFLTSAVRATATTDGSGFWATGSGGGVVYMPFGATGAFTVVSNTTLSHRGINIFDGQLYTSSNAGSYRLGKVGTGTPTSTSNTSTQLPGFPTTNSPQAFFLADLETTVPGMDTLYVADDGSAGATAASGGMKKFSLVAGSWAFKGNFPASTTPAIGASSFFGVTGEVSGTQVTLFATRTTGQFVRFVDNTGYNAAPTAVPTLLATAAANTAFRGVALAPVQPVITPSLSINDVSQSEGSSGTTAYTFTVTLSSPAPAGGVTFNIATGDGTAQDGNPDGEDSDYTASSLTGQTIPVGETSYQFTVQVNGDGIHEPDESYFVNVTNVSGATAADGQGQGTVVNDDLAPTSGPVSIGGRILTYNGRGVFGATVSVMDQNGKVIFVKSDSLGYYRFENVPGGQSYVLTVKSETFRFSPQILTAYADISELNIYPDR